MNIWNQKAKDCLTVSFDGRNTTTGQTTTRTVGELLHEARAQAGVFGPDNQPRRRRPHRQQTKDKTMTYHEADKVLKRIKRQISNGKRSPDDIRKELRALPDTQQQGRTLLDGTCPFAVEARRLLNLTR